MRRLPLTLLGLLCLGLSPGLAQSVLAPGNVAIVCAYNSSPPAIASGGFILVQCDTNGKLITSTGGGGGGAITVADGADVTQGAQADAAYSGSGSATAIAALKGLYAKLTSGIPITNTNANVTPGDGVTTGTYSGGSPTFGGLWLWNGTTYDRAKSAGVTGVAAVGGAAGATPVNVGIVYPAGATAITASATGTTGATTATLAAAVAKSTYICGFSIRANATAAATGNATVTGTITGTLNFTQWTAPAASGLGVTEEVFSPCVQSSATNTGIAAVSAAPGTGGVVSVSAWGFQL